MKCWRERKDNLKYDVLYLIYTALAVSFYMAQTSGGTAGAEGLYSFAGFGEEIIYRDVSFLRIMLLLPLGMLFFLRIRCYLGEQFVIRQKNRRFIYIRILRACISEAALFMALFIIIALCIGSVYYEDMGTKFTESLALLSVFTFLIFLAMLIIEVSVQWITGSSVLGIIVISAFGFYDTAMGYYKPHIAAALIFILLVFMTAERKEFYYEKFENDKI